MSVYKFHTVYPHHPDLHIKVRQLRMKGIHQVTAGLDQLDLIAYHEYGDHDYWSALGAYNNIVNPFHLLNCGFSEIKLFYKQDLDRLLAETVNK